MVIRKHIIKETDKLLLERLSQTMDTSGGLRAKHELVARQQTNNKNTNKKNTKKHTFSHTGKSPDQVVVVKNAVSFIILRCLVLKTS